MPSYALRRRLPEWALTAYLKERHQMVKIVSWNIAQRDEAWRRLLDMDYDIALLQEAGRPPADVEGRLVVDPAAWATEGRAHRPWRTVVAQISQRVSVEWFTPGAIGEAGPEDIAVSQMGTLAAAMVTSPSCDPFVVASLYAPWEKPHTSTEGNWIYADGSAHRLVSDLSTFLGRQKGHRVLAAGDLNVLHGYGEHGSPYWGARYSTVFDRMAAIGLPLVGPQAPSGRQAEPWPDELPQMSKDVPTFYSGSQNPRTATRQLDFVFASSGMKDDIGVLALNDPDEWGPSDHCRVEIKIE